MIGSNGNLDHLMITIREGGFGTPAGMLILGGAVVGGLVWLGFFILGVIICAQGQMLLAVLDSAVHTSPFLNNSLRASIMSLKK
jgi:hypothetical protein